MNRSTRSPFARPRRRRGPASGRLAGILLVAALPAQAAGAESRVVPPPRSGLGVEAFHLPDDQLRGLIAILLEDNPQIRSAEARARSSRERVAQARSLTDPQLTYRYFAETPETRVGPQEHMLELSQAVPWAGKRALQAQRAESLAGASSSEVEDLRRGSVAQLKRAYFEVAYLQEALTVNSEERELLRRFESIALKRYATGVGIQQSVVKVQTDLSRLDDQQTRLREMLAVTMRRIAELLGRPEQPLELGAIELQLPHLLPDVEELERLAVSVHPRVRAVEQRVAADRIWARRQALESRPDFRFGLGYTVVDERQDPAGVVSPPQDNGKDVLALSVGINIPVYRARIRSGVAEARESEQSHDALLEAVRDRLRFDVQQALLRVEASTERGRLFADVIIPQAEESLASAESAYATNRLGFLDLLDAERILFQSRLTYHRLASDFWVALADLELAVGQAFPGEPSLASGAQP